MAEAQAPETAPPAASPPAEVSGDQDVKAESSPAPADAQAAEPPKKKSGGFQKRIDKLTRQVYEQAAIIESLKAEKPQASDKEPQREDYSDLESYQKALAEHVAKRTIREHQRQEEESRKQSQARSEQAKRVQAWESHVEKASEKYEDGEDVLSHFLHSDLQFHPYALDAILESDHGSEIAYYLGKHEEEASRIARLSPARQASEIGKLETKLSEAPKKVSSAPAPIEPVKGGGAETGLRDDIPMSEWIKRRNKQLGR